VFLLTLCSLTYYHFLSHYSFACCNTKHTTDYQVSHGGELRGTYKAMRRLQGGNNPFPDGNEATAGNNAFPIGTEEIGGSNNFAGTDLFRLPSQLPAIFSGQPSSSVNLSVPFFSGGSDGGAFGAFGAVNLRESSPVINPFPDGNEATAGNNAFPIGTEEIGGSNNIGGTDLLRLPSQLSAIFPGLPSSSVNPSVPPFRGGNTGGGFAAFSEVFLKEDPSGGN
jgi:hypothetical protein